MVSVLEGQLTRTWFYHVNNRKHVINLYHDTITGVRSAMVDFQEIVGSLGNSSLLMESKGHRIFFTVEDHPGYIEIKRSGWTGFAYACVINDKPVSEATQEVARHEEEVFRPKIIETTLTPDELSDHKISWYVVRTTRLRDNVTTTVHRRFRDFAELNSQVKQNFKGHHLRYALPPLPEKPLKSLTDHNDAAFIKERAAKLEIYIASLLAVPHVSEMICAKAFVGIMDQVREFSISFHVPTIGMSLLPCDRLAENTPAIVGLIQKPDICSGVLPGDSISKINGVAVAGTNFNGVVTRIKTLPRPLIVHFIQVIAGSVTAGTPTTGVNNALDINHGNNVTTHVVALNGGSGTLNNSNSSTSDKNTNAKSNEVSTPTPTKETILKVNNNNLPTFAGDLEDEELLAQRKSDAQNNRKQAKQSNSSSWNTYTAEDDSNNNNSNNNNNNSSNNNNNNNNNNISKNNKPQQVVVDNSGDDEVIDLNSNNNNNYDDSSNDQGGGVREEKPTTPVIPAPLGWD